MLLMRLDENSGRSKTRQIVEEICRLIMEGILRPGDSLPSTRRLASSLAVHRSTVAAAYQELWALGYIDLQPRMGPKVRERTQTLTVAGSCLPGLVDWSILGARVTGSVSPTQVENNTPQGASIHSRVIDFSVLEVDKRLLPVDRFRSCMDHVLRQYGADLLGYSDCAGFPPLRRYLSDRLKGHGIAATPDEILITNGSQHALDLVFRMIADPGRKVAVESPTYDWALSLLRLHRLVPLEIPLQRDGMDLFVLEKTLQRERPILVYTMPSFQNPSGVSAPQAHREELLRLCEKHRTPILEDGFDEEMKYFGRTTLPIKSMDRHRVVIYCGTFSKVLFSGMRVGWIAADEECIRRLTTIKQMSELSPNAVAQAALYEFCTRGYFDRHLAMMHRVFRKRMQAMTEALDRHISRDWAEWDEPAGGYLIWLRLNPNLASPKNWNDHFASFGVKVTLGSAFFPQAPKGVQLRLSISRLDINEISEGIDRLGFALQALSPDQHD